MSSTTPIDLSARRADGAVGSRKIGAQPQEQGPPRPFFDSLAELQQAPPIGKNPFDRKGQASPAKQGENDGASSEDGSVAALGLPPYVPPSPSPPPATEPPGGGVAPEQGVGVPPLAAEGSATGTQPDRVLAALRGLGAGDSGSALPSGTGMRQKAADIGKDLPAAAPSPASDAVIGDDRANGDSAPPMRFAADASVLGIDDQAGLQEGRGAKVGAADAAIGLEVDIPTLRIDDPGSAHNGRGTPGGQLSASATQRLAVDPAPTPGVQSTGAGTAAPPAQGSGPGNVARALLSALANARSTATAQPASGPGAEESIPSLRTDPALPPEDGLAAEGLSGASGTPEAPGRGQASAPSPADFGSATGGAAAATSGASPLTGHGVGGAQTPAQPVTISVLANHAGWDKTLGVHLLQLAQQNVQQVQLRLDPPTLGTLDVRISLNQDGVSINFLSSQVQAREAIEAAVPRLRQMFVDSGLTLQHVAVSDGSTGGQFSHYRGGYEPPPEPAGVRHPNAPDLRGPDPPEVSRLRPLQGLIDDYA